MWAFEKTPVDLPVIYWSHTFKEIRTYVNLKLSWYQAQALQQHQVMAIILDSAFGDGKTEEEPQSLGQAQAQLGAMFKSGH